MALLITPADKWFSLCVRERANWRCERCGRITPDDKRMGLHCSHWIGRGSWSVRFHPLNAFAHCYGCHAYFEGRPASFSDWVGSLIGENGAASLVRLGHRPARGLRKAIKELSAFYRAEHRKQLEQRKAGNSGYLQFGLAPRCPDIELIDWSAWALQNAS